ncbi:hypothetical protein C1N76_09435 [Geobacillus thermoleovorans]|uniref:Uncharacterized protein n=1 Tax=Geobacillus thermoleovorans TaxID=33941 RepID=A0A2Z3N754_GEOTH|nr:hypothetical protein C1N76_09435 [Geobacillus thermoleovorans]EQB96935.1 hypothetical protein GA8_04245 [Geobacillus sp. A8]
MGALASLCSGALTIEVASCGIDAPFGGEGAAWAKRCMRINDVPLHGLPAFFASSASSGGGQRVFLV